MTAKLLTKHHLEFISLKVGCSDSYESTLVKMTHRWKSRGIAHMDQHKRFWYIFTYRTCANDSCTRLCTYNPFLVYCRELATGTVSLTRDRAQGDGSKHDSHYSGR